MPNIEISPAELSDVPALANIARQTFTETFASANDPTEFAKYVEAAFDETKLLDEVRTEGSAFYFANINEDIAGYLKLTIGEAQTERVPGRTIEIERIYVLESMQGTGVGKALFEFALEKAESQQVDAIWLGVWEENPKAIRFYERQGFQPFGIHSFTIGNEAQNDIMMRFDMLR